jgi:hypothetical protein
MFRLLLILAIAAVIAYFGSTVQLGQRTFFGHVRAVWSTDEARDMRKGLEEKAGPALDRMKRGVEAGIKAATGDDGGPAEGATIDGGPIGDGRIDAPGEGVDDPKLPAEAPPAEPRPAPTKDPRREPKKKHGVTMLAPTQLPSVPTQLAPTQSSQPSRFAPARAA